jgi:hypothetical protein
VVVVGRRIARTEQILKRVPLTQHRTNAPSDLLFASAFVSPRFAVTFGKQSRSS